MYHVYGYTVVGTLASHEECGSEAEAARLSSALRKNGLVVEVEYKAPLSPYVRFNMTPISKANRRRRR
jgi:hypothetical protein